MILAGYVISGLIALAIILIGLRFLLSPAAATRMRTCPTSQAGLGASTHST